MELTEQNRWKNGGSCKKYTYTTKDIALITYRAIGTIRNDITHGKLSMDDLVSVAQYITKYSR